MNFINNTIIQNSFKQKTLKKKIFFSGVGVHSGRAVSMSIEPADVNTGIFFRRTDIEYNNDIQALIQNIDTSNLCTKIKNNLGWSPKEHFESGIFKTVRWYLENLSWTDNIQNGNYKLCLLYTSDAADE